MTNVVKLILSDVDDCSEHARECMDTIEEHKITNFMWVGLNDEGEAFYGRTVNNSDKVTLIGALELLKANLVRTLE